MGWQRGAGNTPVVATTDEAAVHDRATRPRPAARSGTVTLDLDREGVAVTTDEGDRPRASSAEHREDVVRRLLGAGLSPDLLRALLPGFATLIDELDEA
jgi:hypothetical protein